MPGRTPDFRIVVATILTNAGTTQANPLKTTINLGDVTLIDVEIVVPDGHCGATGIAVVSDGFGIAPWDPSVSYFVGNNETPVFPIDMTMGHPFQVWTYNTGAFDHHHYLRFKVRDTSLDSAREGPVLAVVKDAAAIEGAGVDTTSATVAVDDGSGTVADDTAVADAVSS